MSTTAQLLPFWLGFATGAVCAALLLLWWFLTRRHAAACQERRRILSTYRTGYYHGAERKCYSPPTPDFS